MSVFFTFRTSVDVEVHSSVHRSVTAATTCDSRHDLTSKPKTIVPFIPLSGAIHLNQSDLLILSVDFKKTKKTFKHILFRLFGSPGKTNLVLQLLGRQREPDLLWLPGRHLVVLLRGIERWDPFILDMFGWHQIWSLVVQPGRRTPSHYVQIKWIYIGSIPLKPRPSLPDVKGSLLLFCVDSLRLCDSC